MTIVCLCCCWQQCFHNSTSSLVVVVYQYRFPLVWGVVLYHHCCCQFFGHNYYIACNGRLMLRWFCYCCYHTHQIDNFLLLDIITAIINIIHNHSPLLLCSLFTSLPSSYFYSPLTVLALALLLCVITAYLHLFSTSIIIIITITSLLPHPNIFVDLLLLFNSLNVFVNVQKWNIYW